MRPSDTGEFDESDLFRKPSGIIQRIVDRRIERLGSWPYIDSVKVRALHNHTGSVISIVTFFPQIKTN